MPRMDDDTLGEFLEQPHVGVIASLRRNGMPYSVPVWWLHDDGDFWITGTTSRVWCKQLLADDRCTLCIEALEPVAGFASVDGRAEAFTLPEFDIWPICRALVDKYVQQGDPKRTAAADKFFANMQTEPRMLFRIRPEVRRAIDMRVYEGKRADREHQAAQTKR